MFFDYQNFPPEESPSPESSGFFLLTLVVARALPLELYLGVYWISRWDCLPTEPFFVSRLVPPPRVEPRAGDPGARTHILSPLEALELLAQVQTLA
jgi:hypothetical protein